MQLNCLRSWIYEVALHNESWEMDARQDGQSSVFYISTAPSNPYNMLWKLLEANNTYIQDFLALPGKDLSHLSLSSFTRLCYVLISQARVTFALLDCVEKNIGNTDQDQEGQNQASLAKLVVDRARYSTSCSSLMDKFAAASQCSEAGGENLDPMLQFCNTTRSMMQGYSNQLQNRTELRIIAPTTSTAPAVSKQQLAAGDARAESDIINTGLWDNADMVLAEDGGTFDNMAWETIMSEFTLPFGGQSGLGLG